LYVSSDIVDSTIVDAIKLILLNYNNINIAKIVAKNISIGKITQSRLPTNTKLIPNKLVLIKVYKKVSQTQ